MFGHGLRFALRRQKQASQGLRSVRDRTSLLNAKASARAGKTETAGGPNLSIKVGQMTISKVGHT